MGRCANLLPEKAVSDHDFRDASLRRGRVRRAPVARGPGRNALLLVALAAAGLTACPIDDRTLEGAQVVVITGTGGASGRSSFEAGAGNAGEDDGGGAEPGDGGTAGTSLGGGAGGSGTGGVGAGYSGSAGTGRGGSGGGTGGSSETGGGSSGTAGGPVNTRCPDLDHNGVLDCDETLIDKAAFDTDASVAAWSIETGLVLSWSNLDAQGHDQSGSLAVKNDIEENLVGTQIVGARQCINVSGGTVYRFAAQVSVPNYAGETKAGIQIIVLDTPSCAGTVLDSPTTNLVKGPEWQVAEIIYLTPTTAKSIAVRLAQIKPFRQAPVAVLFDNVLVRADETP